MRYLLTFFLRSGVHSRRTLWMGVLGLFPVGFTVLLWIVKPFIGGEDGMLWGLFPQISRLLFLNLLIPLMAVFVGSAVIADEVEERTLPYLLTRPVPRGSIVLAKMCAGAITLGVILISSLVLTYTVLVLEVGSGGWFSNLSILCQCGGVLLLGLLAYLPLFTFVGGTLKRPVLIGLLFTFGWERLVAFMPGNIKFLTVVHYLQVLRPDTFDGRSIDIQSEIFRRVLPTREISDLSAIIILVGMALLFTLLSMLLLRFKEYRLEQDD